MKYKIGDVVKLKAEYFNPNGQAYRCIKSGHLFILLGMLDDRYIACISSSKINKVSDRFPYNILLQDATQAGYNNPKTHIKIDQQTIPVPKEAILKKIGHVSDRDYNKLIRVFINVPKNKVLTLEELENNIELFKLLLQS